MSCSKARRKWAISFASFIPKLARVAAGTLRRLRTLRAAGALLLLLGAPRFCAAYSLLTHEQVVDVCWRDEIEPLLLARFPAASPEQLRRAHAFAYGGCLIQDIGYYPFGDRFFSDLTHYVRTGEFVANLIRESADLEQYAFALGALSHYASDNAGHPFINHTVALGFPRLRAKYGDSVTYAQNPKAHIRTEFGFDLVQVSKGRYTSENYHNFIGFEVSKPLLERAFERTYSLKLEEVIGHVDLAIGTFRRAVSLVIPEMTRVALLVYRPEIVGDTPNFHKRRFLYNLSRTEYEKVWGTEYRRPNLGERFLALLVKLVPKVGPMRALAFKVPSTAGEDLYIQSVNKTVENYKQLLRASGRGPLELPDLDCDTGKPARAGEYALSDQAHARLLEFLSHEDPGNVNPELRKSLLAFYSNSSSLAGAHQSRKARRRAQSTLEALRAMDAGSRAQSAGSLQRP